MGTVEFYLRDGWKRLEVTRKNGIYAGKADIYVYSPDGNKFRSKKELQSYLTSNNLPYTVEELFTGTSASGSNSSARAADKGKSSQRASSAERPRRASSAERPRRASSAERPRRASSAERPQRTTSAERPQRTTSSERPQRTTSSERPQRTTSSERPQRTTSSERPQRTTSSERPQRAGAFESPQRAGAFGSQQRAGAFESPQRAGAFGSQQRAGAFESPQRAGAFGSQQRAGAFGSPQRAGAFGSQQRANPFGSPQRANPFGSPPRANPFGSPPRANPFGSPPRANPFGSPPRASPFGSPPRASPFGSPPRANPFGSPPRANPFGSPPRGDAFVGPSRASAFERPQRAVGFGSQPRPGAPERPQRAIPFERRQRANPFGPPQRGSAASRPQAACSTSSTPRVRLPLQASGSNNSNASGGTSQSASMAAPQSQRTAAPRPASPGPSANRQSASTKSKSTSPFYQTPFGNSSFVPHKYGPSSLKGRPLRPPTPPERPLMPYMRYSQAVWEIVKAKNPTLKLWEVGRIIGQQWRELPPELKVDFVEEYEIEKVEYDRAVKKYYSSPSYQKYLRERAVGRSNNQNRDSRQNHSSEATERKLNVEPAEEEDDLIDVYPARAMAYARYLRNHRLMSQIFGDTLALPEVKVMVSGLRMNIYKRQVASLKSHQQKLRTELREVREAFEARQAKINEDCMRFNRQMKKFTQVSDKTFEKMVEQQYEVLKMALMTDSGQYYFEPEVYSVDSPHYGCFEEHFSNDKTEDIGLEEEAAAAAAAVAAVMIVPNSEETKYDVRTNATVAFTYAVNSISSSPRSAHYRSARCGYGPSQAFNPPARNRPAAQEPSSSQRGQAAEQQQANGRHDGHGDARFSPYSRERQAHGNAGPSRMQAAGNPAGNQQVPNQNWPGNNNRSGRNVIPLGV